MNISMKNIKYFLGALLMAGTMVACSPDEFPGMNEAGVPEISQYTSAVKVDVNQETNEVTFSLDAPGVYPVWVITEGDKEYRSSLNGYSRKFLVAGTYAYKCYVASRDGVSTSYTEGTFTLNTSRIDISKEKGFLTAKPWRIASSKPGHLGCGENLGNPTGWWSAAPNEKADWGVYDCVVTFAEDGNYTLNPGESGVIYVNKDVTVNGWDANYTGDGNDYNVPVDGDQNSKWSIEIDGTDLWINLGTNPYFPYIANNDVWNTPRYKILSISSKSMTLACFNGGIAWNYILTNEEEESKDPKDILTSSPWRIANDAAGHLGCGPNLDDPKSWWAANPNEKDGFGVYDCIVTFAEDGTYTMDPGESGVIYVNKEFTALGHAVAGEDFTIEVDGVQTSTWTLKDDVINLGSNPYFPYLANNDVWENPEYHITEITEEKINLVIVNNDIAWNYILVKAKPEALDYNDANNLWKGVDDGSRFVSISPWFSPAGWGGGLTPDYSYADGVYTLTIPEGMGSDQWMGQFPINTDLTASMDDTYNFSCTIEATEDCPGVTIKLTETDDAEKHDNNFFFADRHDVTGGEPFIYTVKNVKLPLNDAHALSLFFDFGGSPVGATVKISNIVLIKN